MFFCPNCSNSYDITKPSTQSGGGTDTLDTVSSQTTASSVGGGGVNLDKLIDKILNKDNIINEQITISHLDDLKKNPSFKKLDKKTKEIVYNTIADQVPKQHKIKQLTDEEKKNNIAFFKCNNCGHMQQIKDGTRIYARSFGVDDKFHINRVNNHLVDSHILLRTRRYSCPNEKCNSHTDETQKEAVIHRIGDSYMIGYMCCSCNTNWLN
jgi:hypothetical protein